MNELETIIKMKIMGRQILAYVECCFCHKKLIKTEGHSEMNFRDGEVMSINLCEFES